LEDEENATLSVCERVSSCDIVHAAGVVESISAVAPRPAVSGQISGQRVREALGGSEGEFLGC
jgi:hypothetical protein